MSTPAYYLMPPPPPQVVLPAGTAWQRIVSPPPAEAEWWVYREALARLARACFAHYGWPVIVRAGWHLRLKIGETLTQLKNGPLQTPRKPEGSGDIRGWMFNFERMMQPEPRDDTIGTHAMTVTLQVTAWGVHGYDRRTGADSAQARLEAECRALMWGVKQNTKLGLVGLADQNLSAVTPLNFPAVDLHGFSDGTEAFIAQGAMQLVVTEQDTRPVPEDV